MLKVELTSLLEEKVSAFKHPGYWEELCSSKKKEEKKATARQIKGTEEARANLGLRQETGGRRG